MNDRIGRRGLCLVLAAPSGAGKSTIARALLAREWALQASVSATTRAMRPGERPGVDYHFLNPSEFQALIGADALLEWAEVFGRRYGTPRAPVEAALSGGRDVIFDIDWQGWRSVKAALPDDAVGVFIMPPSLAALRTRLEGRAGDSTEEIERRMALALAEIGHWAEFDHIVVNSDLERCVAEVQAVLHAARCRVGRLTGMTDFVAQLLPGAGPN